jgi:flagellar biogenesis protein FliO
MYRLIVASVLLGVILIALTMRRGGPARARSMKITSRTALHRGAYVAVVEIDGRRLLIGAGTQQVTLLTELGPAPDPAPVAPTATEPLPLSTVADAPADDHGTLIDRVRRATTRTPRPQP